MIKKYLFLRDPGTPGEGGGGTAPLIGEASAEQIAEWKEKYKLGIYMVVAGNQVGYFKNPSRKEINCALYSAEPESPLSAYEELAALTMLPGQSNMAMLEDDTIYSTLMAAIKDKFNGVRGALVNL